jgi:hypothetical protein
LTEPAAYLFLTTAIDWNQKNFYISGLPRL